MSYVFHDIKRIVDVYLDNLDAHSKKQTNHPTHLKAIFDRCRKYKIRLNQHKCIFCVVSHIFLGFIVSKYDIMVDPLKVEEMFQLHTLTKVRQL